MGARGMDEPEAGRAFDGREAGEFAAGIVAAGAGAQGKRSGMAGAQGGIGKNERSVERGQAAELAGALGGG